VANAHAYNKITAKGTSYRVTKARWALRYKHGDDGIL